MYEAKMEQMEPDILVDVSSVFQNPLRCAVIRGLPVNKFVFSVIIKVILIFNANSTKLIAFDIAFCKESHIDKKKIIIRYCCVIMCVSDVKAFGCLPGSLGRQWPG